MVLDLVGFLVFTENFVLEDLNGRRCMADTLDLVQLNRESRRQRSRRFTERHPFY